MNEITYITVIGLLTGIMGTVGGGLIVLMLRKIEEGFLTFILGISAGVMTVIVFLDLIPEALEMGNTITTLAGMFLGVGIIGLMDFVFPHIHHPEKAKNNYYKAGVLLALGIALHNVPEGLAIGAGFSAERTLGIGLAVIIGIHNCPEGMAVATSLSLSGVRGFKILAVTMLAGIPMGLGAFLGAYLGNISSFFLSLSLGFAAGAMLFITFDELIPSAHERNNGKLAITGILLGVFLGIILTNNL
ncbi:MAG: ZIP family metal transporter [Bacillota bacterium]